ncbi:MAG: tripartite tricarboxylate transporter substrate binding protein [Burkholderiales bacterium]|nr:tripartite tricarboxylate transporter substrate binding protein [Burkholderiales bacterium]
MQSKTVVTVLLFAVCAGAQAQTFPVKPLKLVAPFPPGGLVDSAGRIAAEGMGAALGQPMVVENRPGASGKIAAEAVSRAPADGYTLFFANGTSHGSLPVMDPGFDPVKDFAPVGVIIYTPFILAANPGLMANSVAELVALARAQPGTINYATPGVGSAAHFAGELLRSQAGIDIVHVPFKGLAQAVQDVMGGAVQLTFDNAILQHLKAGKLKAIATTGLQRLEFLPEVATLDESGLKGYDIVGWAGVAVPIRTPPALIARLSEALRQTMSRPEVQNRLKALALSPMAGTPEHMARLTSESIARYRKIATESRMKFE